MKVEEFQDVVQNLLESIKLSEQERKYVCQKYFRDFVKEGAQGNDTTMLIECANALGEIIRSSYEDSLSPMPLESFREFMYMQDNEYPYDCSYFYNIVEELQVCENIFDNKPSVNEEENDFFAEEFLPDKTTLHVLYEEYSEILSRSVRNKEAVHKALEGWLNNYIMSKYKCKLISPRTMDSIIKVAELIEERFKTGSTTLSSTEAVYLMYGDNPNIGGVLNIAHLLEEISLINEHNIKANSIVTFSTNGTTQQGKVLGVYEDKKYIIQHAPSKEGYTASVIDAADIKEVL